MEEDNSGIGDQFFFFLFTFPSVTIYGNGCLGLSAKENIGL